MNVGKVVVSVALCLVLASCNEAGPQVSAQPAAEVTRAPAAPVQICRIAADRCMKFNEGLSSFGPVLSKSPSARNSIETTTVDVLFNALLKDQAEANASCEPATGSLRRIAQLQPSSGRVATLMGTGTSTCALIVAN